MCHAALSSQNACNSSAWATAVLTKRFWRCSDLELALTPDWQCCLSESLSLVSMDICGCSVSSELTFSLLVHKLKLRFEVPLWRSILLTLRAMTLRYGRWSSIFRRNVRGHCQAVYWSGLRRTMPPEQHEIKLLFLFEMLWVSAWSGNNKVNHLLCLVQEHVTKTV